jgi:hypothetical protein
MDSTQRPQMPDKHGEPSLSAQRTKASDDRDGNAGGLIFIGLAAVAVALMRLRAA